MLLDAACTDPPPAPPVRNPAPQTQSHDDAEPCGDRGNDAASHSTKSYDNSQDAPSDPDAAAKLKSKDATGKASDDCKAADTDQAENKQNAANDAIAQIALTAPVVGAVMAPVSGDCAPVRHENQSTKCMGAFPAAIVTATFDTIPDTEAPQTGASSLTATDTQSIDATTEPSDDSSPPAPAAISQNANADTVPAVSVNSVKTAGAIEATAPAGQSADTPPPALSTFAELADTTQAAQSAAKTNPIEPTSAGEDAERVNAAAKFNAPAPKKPPQEQSTDPKAPTKLEKPPADAMPPNTESSSNSASTNAAPHAQNAKTGGAKAENEPEQDQSRPITTAHAPAPETAAASPNRLNSAAATLLAGSDTAPISGAQTVATQAAPAPLLPAPAAFPIAVPNAIPLSGLPIEIASQAKDGKNRFEIRLDPPELGRIDVRLDIDKQGNVTSRLMVERPETLDLLRRDAAQLERALQNAGLKTSDQGMQFSLRDQSFSGGSDSAPAATSFVLSDDDSAPAAILRQGYGQVTGLGAGIDIRV